MFPVRANLLTAYIVANKGGKWVADLAWENPAIQMSFSNGVLIGDAIFSMSPLNSGQFFWADAKTGKTLWLSEPRQGGNAAITRSGDLLFVLKDTGELMVGQGERQAWPLRQPRPTPWPRAPPGRRRLSRAIASS